MPGELGERWDDASTRLAGLGEIAAEVAHELRNLLLVISSSAYVARTLFDRDDAAAARPQIAKIERVSRAAHALVDDLLGLARGDALHKEVVRATDLLAQARADFAEGAAQWNDDVPTDLEVQAQPRLFARLMHALYENAIGASAPRAPTIMTRVTAAREHVTFDVTDDGPGVAPDVAARIFEPLVSGRAGGSGLGLALGRRIATAHGGKLALASASSEGGGATFRVVLPR